jgi:hypothetical protein
LDKISFNFKDGSYFDVDNEVDNEVDNDRDINNNSNDIMKG